MKERLLSQADSLTLLRACLASIPIYLLSVIKISETGNKYDKYSYMGHFLWDNIEEKHRHHLANWRLVAQKKEFRGLGIPDLRSLNLALLSALILRCQLNKNAVWIHIVDCKCVILKNQMFSVVLEYVGTSLFFWKGVVWVMQAARMGIH